MTIPLICSGLLITVSGSDYKATRKAAEKAKQRLSRRGKQVHNSEDEDEEDDIALAAEVESESGLSNTGQNRASTSKRKAKGKAPAKAPSKAPGPLGKEGVEAAQALGAKTMEEADRLAKEYNTTRRNILIVANIALKESRGPNSYNQHKEWYTNHFPISKGGVFIPTAAHIRLKTYAIHAHSRGVCRIL